MLTIARICGSTRRFLMNSTYSTPASVRRGDVVSMTLQGKIPANAEIPCRLGTPAAGCGLSFGL
jgi:hypothetical protein